MNPDLFRSGVATETLYLVLKLAFEDANLRMHRVIFETSPQNVRMRAWLERFGIYHEFTFREAWKAVDKDEWEDVVGYSILEREWKESIKGKLEDHINRYSRSSRT